LGGSQNPRKANVRTCHRQGQPGGSGVGSHIDPAALARWLDARPADELSEPFTFVVSLDGQLRLAPRRSEHVDCAAGQPVLAAGEVLFSQDWAGWSVIEISNQSAGYCPDPDSWPGQDAGPPRPGAPRRLHAHGYLPPLPRLRLAQHRPGRRFRLRGM
jgi:hypothetical protein